MYHQCLCPLVLIQWNLFEMEFFNRVSITMNIAVSKLVQLECFAVKEPANLLHVHCLEGQMLSGWRCIICHFDTPCHKQGCVCLCLDLCLLDAFVLVSPMFVCLLACLCRRFAYNWCCLLVLHSIVLIVSYVKFPSFLAALAWAFVCLVSLLCQEGFGAKTLVPSLSRDSVGHIWLCYHCCCFHEGSALDSTHFNIVSLSTSLAKCQFLGKSSQDHNITNLFIFCSISEQH